MAIYEIAADRIQHVPPTSFEAERFRERGDLQRLLRDHIDVVAPDIMVISEEFGTWEDSRRRIDLLCLDKEANIVVVELKRTDDGGHMDLQAIRYAAMVSALTFHQVVSAHDAYLGMRSIDRDGRESILQFLGWEEPHEEQFAQNVRILLVAEGFSRELTTAVLWLNQHDLDILCVRLRPYTLDGRLIIDVQQTIPLPEAAEYQVQIRKKSQQERVARASERDYTKFDLAISGTVYSGLAKRNAMYQIVKSLTDNGVTPEQTIQVVPELRRKWRRVEGNVDASTFKELASTQAQNDGKAFDPRRWFCGENELIHANSGTYAFSNQWGIGAVEFANRLIAAFPEAGITFTESEQAKV